ncbi:Ycf66 family protein [Spirulina major CS-329]|uniref:Ycf66 family protein n=1 Tax=Spirulina TaxID=1154 RepID=UPI00232AF87E|nr:MULTISPECIES: Ycf66 family protein [Spirulina]MDB9493346.1 Ycf66 family protein [Spirulina subsalsa CS-330]MDB9502515.1 Ycf66 family protein [Spirulina major CS-329]
MINFGWNSASILGVFLAVAGAGLYFLRSIKPELSRDYDIFFSAVGLVCGGILIAYGWKFDPLMQLGQFLLTLATFFFAFETLRLRGLATEQARRSTPIVDDDRPVSRSYRAYREPDYDELEPAYREPAAVPRKRLRGSDDYDDAPAPSPRSRAARPTTDRSSPPPRSPRSRRPSRDTPPSRDYPPDETRYADRYDAWEDEWEETEGVEERRSGRRSPSRRPDDRTVSEPERPRRNGSARNAALYEDEEPAPYVDYVDYDEELEPEPPRSSAPRDDRYGDEYDDYGEDDFEAGVDREPPDYEDEPDLDFEEPRSRRRPDRPYDDDVEPPVGSTEY